MLGSRKKAPTVKIPSTVLKREAEKAAKKMMQAEKKKEQRKVLREKAKAKASAKVARNKSRAETHKMFFDAHWIRELYAGGFISLGILILALFFSSAPLALTITQQGFQNLFGQLLWLVPLSSIILGGVLFFHKDLVFPPLRVLALLGSFAVICGLANLLVPHSDSLALSHHYGGALGFSIGFFPREFFGTTFTLFFLLVLGWWCATVGFEIRWKCPDLTQLRVKKEERKKPGNPTEKSEEVLDKPERFHNEIEIIDSTKSNSDKPNEKTEIPLESQSEEDRLNEAKNRTFDGWTPPHLGLLEDKPSTITVDETALREQAEVIREKLDQFGIEVEMKSVHVGPTVTQFTLEPSAGVKLNKITALKSDLALALAAPSLRIEAPIRGKKLVGIEIPNAIRATVGMREILASDAWEEEGSPLKLAVGRDVAGKPITVDLAKMPHLLIAGKTGSGKSVAMNAFLLSLLWNNSPENLRMIMIDPKRVELAPYNYLPHLLTPVIVEPEKSVSALAWAVAEMNRRYKDFSQKGCRNIGEHNDKFSEQKEPYIVIVVDELADLMMVAGKDVEAALCRIAQMARAVGMHLIVATQRPSVDVVTGLIKANLPTRIAFRVSSGIDSRTIIDGVGAEDLLGMGDMLYMDGNSGDLSRIQGLYVTTEEVEAITNYIKLQYPEKIGNDEIQEEITTQSIEGMAKGGVLTAGMNGGVSDEGLDDLFNQAVDLATETGKASASLFQRRLEVGYARAARILDQMEQRGIIGPARGAKPREIYGRQE